MAAVMLRRMLGATVWLFVGHAALAGLYWALLNVPESNVLALSLSALLVLLLVVGACIVDVTGLLWLRPEWRFRAALARSIRVLPVFLLALAMWWAVSWFVGRYEARYLVNKGELDAWLIAHFNITRNAWLQRLMPILFAFVRDVLGVSLAVSLVAAAAVGSFFDIFRFRWLLRALSPVQLVIIAVAVAGLIWLPGQGVYWRPAWIRSSSMELAFIGVKLTVLGLIAHLGWALILWAPHDSARGPHQGGGAEPVGVRVPVPPTPENRAGAQAAPLE